jgi:hypothetical protein
MRVSLRSKFLVMLGEITITLVSQSSAATNVWIVVGVPTPRPVLGDTFSTTLGISAWNGRPGAVDFTIRNDPKVLRLMSASLVQDSSFFPNTYLNTTFSATGRTRIVCFQADSTRRFDTLVILGNMTWKVVGVGDSTTDINVDVADVVEIKRSPVEVFAFGQHIEFHLTSIENNPQIPMSYDLGYNYPNPFNPSTMIPYQVPEKARVSITVFDVLGRSVVTLVDEEKTQGRYLVEWRGENRSGNQVSTGVYFYRMKAGHFEASRKMLLLR